MQIKFIILLVITLLLLSMRARNIFDNRVVIGNQSNDNITINFNTTSPNLYAIQYNFNEQKWQIGNDNNGFVDFGIETLVPQKGKLLTKFFDGQKLSQFELPSSTNGFVLTSFVNSIPTIGLGYTRLIPDSTMFKGSILSHDGNDITGHFVGANNEVLVADSSTGSGLNYLNIDTSLDLYNFDQLTSYSSVGTFTFNRNINTKFLVFLYCGGGGGGRSTSGGSSTIGVAGQGGEGGVGRICFVKNPSSSYTITVGARGTQNNNGTATSITGNGGCENASGGLAGTVLTLGNGNSTFTDVTTGLVDFFFRDSISIIEPTYNNATNSQLLPMIRNSLGGVVSQGGLFSGWGFGGRGGYTVFPIFNSVIGGVTNESNLPITFFGSPLNGSNGNLCQGGGGGFGFTTNANGGNGGNGHVLVLEYF
jgi:hypothetical protein